ncbi:MAG: hypothetical protein NT080_05025 [Spirochaetes bacterium]|nr:hypothetical protein [Spirochaetota bacterium]
MNQDQVKAMLLGLKDATTEFSVVFSGKKSSLVNGLYKPATREIILHNRNFEDDGQLVYTAIHEYAHHVHSERTKFVTTARSHTNEFWTIFHELIEKAEADGIYRNRFDEPEFAELTRRIKSACLAEDGRIMLEFGRLVADAERLCREKKVRFEDYIDRALGVPRMTAYTAMKAASYGLETGYGWDAMKLLAGVRDPGRRSVATEAFRAGKPPETIKSLIRSERPSEDPIERLAKERDRIERTIEHLQARLKEIERELGRA